MGKYLWSRGLFTAVGAYFLFSILLLAATGIDICIPCIWYTIFDVHCPGCGLTKAFVHIVKLDFVAAWGYNPLAYVVLPAGAIFLYLDVTRFLRGQQAQAASAVA